MYLEKMQNKTDILRLGMVYPLPRQAIMNFLKSHEEVKVLEELDDFIEEKSEGYSIRESIIRK